MKEWRFPRQTWRLCSQRQQQQRLQMPMVWLTLGACGVECPCSGKGCPTEEAVHSHRCYGTQLLLSACWAIIGERKGVGGEREIDGEFCCLWGRGHIVQSIPNLKSRAYVLLFFFRASCAHLLWKLKDTALCSVTLKKLYFGTFDSRILCQPLWFEIINDRDKCQNIWLGVPNIWEFKNTVLLVEKCHLGVS